MTRSFSKKMDEALEAGVEFVNDMSESQLLTLIKEKSFPALSFWLKHRHDKYKNKLEIKSTVNTIQELSEEQRQMVENALKLAGVILDKNN